MVNVLIFNVLTMIAFSTLLLIPAGLPYSEAQIDNTYKFDAGFYDRITQMQSERRVSAASGVTDLQYYTVIIITGDKNDLINDLQDDYNARNIFDPENLDNVVTADVPISEISRLAEIHNVVKIGDGELELESLVHNDPRKNFVSTNEAKEYHGVTSQIAQTGNGVTIGVVDVYNDGPHDDLPDSDIIDRVNCYGASCISRFDSSHFGESGSDDIHFNHAASIITGTGASFADMTGIAPDSKIRLTIADDTGAIVRALDYLAGRNVDLITMIAGASTSECSSAYGGRGFSSVALIVDSVVQNGVPVIMSNGNGAGVTSLASACSYNGIGVGNTDIHGRIHPSSSRGPAYNAINPDISAVGTSIAGAGTGIDYRVGTGTSFSAPVVASVAALLLDKDASLSSNEVRTALLLGADFGRAGESTAKLYEDTANTGLRNYIHTYGFGKLDAADSLELVNDNRFPNIISDSISESSLTKKYRIIAESGDEVKVLMSWNVATVVRQGGIILAEGQIPLDSLKNYNLKITTPDGTEITSDSIAQNKEFVFFDADQSGIYEITVSLDDRGLRTVGYALGSSHPIDADPYDVDFPSLACQENQNCQTPLPDPPTISAITIPNTSSSTATHVLAVSNVPTGYSFTSATPATNLSADNVTASGVDSNGTVTITFGLPTVSSSTPISGDLNVRYSDGTNNLDVVVPVTITVVPSTTPLPDPPTISAITIPNTSSSTATHVLAVSNVPTGYSFSSATPAANLSDDNVTASGVDVNGTVTITFGLPTVSTSTVLSGDLNVRYSDGTNNLDVVVPVTITVVPPDPPTISAITIPSTSSSTATHVLAVTNVPTGYSFSSATPAANLSTDGVTASGVDVNGTVTITFDLSTVSRPDVITGTLNVRYSDGTNNLPVVPVPVTITVVLPDPPTISAITIPSTSSSTATHVLAVSNVPTGYSFTSATPAANLSADNVTASGEDVNGAVTITFGLPTVSTSTVLSGDLNVRYSDGTNNLDVVVPVTITVVPVPPIQLTPQISASGILTNTYSQYLTHSSVYFHVGTQFTPVPSNVIVQLTDTDFAYSAFVGDRSVAFTTDDFFNFRIFGTGTDTTPYYYASGSTTLVEIPECTEDSFDGDRLADGIMACHVFNTTQGGTIEIRTIQSGNYVLVSDGTPPVVRPPPVVQPPPDPPTISAITIPSTSSSTATHILTVSNVPTGYSFISAASANLSNNVSASGTDVNGTVTITFNLPTVNAPTPITGNLNVLYGDGINTLTSVVPVTITVVPSTTPLPDPPTISAITIPSTSSSTATHVLAVSDVPTGYSFSSATPAANLSTDGVTASGVDSNGTVTITFGLPTVSSSTPISGDLNVRYSDGTNNLDVVVPVTITVVPPDPPTISAITIPSTSSSTATHVLAVTNIPAGYSFSSATPAANLSTDGVTASGVDVNGTVTITFGLPTRSTLDVITGTLNVRYSDGTNSLPVVPVPVTITVVPPPPTTTPPTTPPTPTPPTTPPPTTPPPTTPPTTPPPTTPAIQLPLRLSADGILTNTYTDYLDHSSVYFHVGTQFTPVPSNVIVQLTDTDFVYSAFLGDRSTAFIADDFFNFRIYNTGTNTTPYYYATDPTNLVEIPECTVNSFDGDRPADSFVACYDSNTTQGGTIEIRTFHSGNYVIVSDGNTTR